MLWNFPCFLNSMKFISYFLKDDVVPRGVKILTYITAIRWIGWGFADALLPVFLFSFAQNYATTSLLRSAYDVAFILSLPVAGMLADRIRATSLIIFGLIIYLFIGSGYFLAGLTGFVLFAVTARFLNGISYSFDVLGRDTYTRRVTRKEHLATVFGFVDTFATFWWIAAAIAGIFLIKYFSIHTLLFLITPTSLVALFIAWKFRRHGEETGKKQAVASKIKVKTAYMEAVKEFGMWGWNLRLLGVFNFFIAFCSAVVGFFLPIEAYSANGNFSQAMLIGILLVVPTLFGSNLGKWFDKKGISLFPYCFLLFGFLLFLLAFSDSYLVKLGVAFGVGIVLELLSLGSNELITVCANPEHFGRVGGVMRSIHDMGGMVGPLVIGILIDWQGVHLPYVILAAIMIFLAIMFYSIKDKVSSFFILEDKYHHKVHQR